MWIIIQKILPFLQPGFRQDNSDPFLCQGASMEHRKDRIVQALHAQLLALTSTLLPILAEFWEWPLPLLLFSGSTGVRSHLPRDKSKIITLSFTLPASALLSPRGMLSPFPSRSASEPNYLLITYPSSVLGSQLAGAVERGNVPLQVSPFCI